MAKKQRRVMTRKDIKNGAKFFHKDAFREEEFEIIKDHGNTYLRKKKVYAGRVENIDEDGMDVGIFLFAIKVSLRVRFENCAIVINK